MIVAVVGKGGTGKTTVSSLLTRSFLDNNIKPLLAVDADPNHCLDAKLGVEVETTIGDIREDSIKLKYEASAGRTKQEIVETEVQQAIIESRGFDLLVMGRQEGPGCYCYLNNLLRSQIDKLGKAYNTIIIDNEAGMEHLSRRTNAGVDTMLFVCNPTRLSIRTVSNLKKLADSLDFRIDNKYLILNRCNGTIPDNLKVELEKTGMTVLGMVPDDPEILECELQDKSIFSLDNNSGTLQIINSMVKNIIDNGGT